MEQTPRRTTRIRHLDKSSTDRSQDIRRHCVTIQTQICVDFHLYQYATRSATSPRLRSSTVLRSTVILKYPGDTVCGRRQLALTRVLTQYVNTKRHIQKLLKRSTRFRKKLQERNADEMNSFTTKIRHETTRQL